MSNVISLAAFKRQRTAEQLDALGEILREVYEKGMPVDEEMNIWLAMAEKSLTGYQDAVEWHSAYLKK